MLLLKQSVLDLKWGIGKYSELFCFKVGYLTPELVYLRSITLRWFVVTLTVTGTGKIRISTCLSSEVL